MDDTTVTVIIYTAVVFGLLCWINYLRSERSSMNREINHLGMDYNRLENTYFELREEFFKTTNVLDATKQFIDSDDNIYLRIQRDHELALALFAVESLEKGNYELAENYEMDLLQKEQIHSEIVAAFNKQREYVIGLEDRVEETERERDFLQKRVDDLTGV